MRNEVMTARRFRDILDAYGADPARWPDGEREDARAFAASNPEAAEWLAEARALDDMLRVVDEIAVTERLHFQTVAKMIAANDVGGPMPAVKPRRLAVFWAGAGVAACLAGAVLGMNLSLDSLDDLRAESVLEQAQMIEMAEDLGNG
ncbi:hypothetical protein ABI_27030 [Asticcacaulis biprosthecium C19]|uniref:Uncharacterized protein n=1 Tax=Asticcacaulis biprosthecium C19 TaxID=715226 RepID=F4QPN0_9CAUL|nr:hypothetical protein [Asticcacaulis biprosthecium]EGF91288.1 hypothetical protein ABI_27030 [Asticcacaulis biprosthecium C19]